MVGLDRGSDNGQNFPFALGEENIAKRFSFSPRLREIKKQNQKRPYYRRRDNSSARRILNSASRHESKVLDGTIVAFCLLSISRRQLK